ncbi:MAG TPA: hypothetical protein VNT54_06935, partial [Solirubrobacteraceae bacterium]|nr:hypothetical protein [Solirubrobacteraceae bacterium]
MKNDEDHATVAAKAASASAEAYERFVTQAKSAVASAAETISEKAEAVVGATGFRHGVSRLLGRDEPAADERSE